MKKTIFLAGPIRGLPRKVSLSWRTKAKKNLESKFVVLHALRGREITETFPDPRLAVRRDKSDIDHSDIVLVNDTIKEVSMIGTAMEVLYAYSRDKMVILFGEAHIGDYWLDGHAHGRFESLDEAVKFINDYCAD